MKKSVLSLAAAGAALAFAMPAMAAVIVDTHPYENPDPQVGIHNIANQTGNVVTGKLNGSNPLLLYDFSSNPLESLTSNGNGHAVIEATDGGMFALTMTPQTPAGWFTRIDFNVNVPNGQVARDVEAIGPIADYVSFDLVLSDNTVFQSGAYPLGGNNMWLIFGDAGEVFKSITWKGWTSANKTTAAQFQDLRQIDLDPAPGVPEPATWALMILGFGAVGAAMRRKQVKVIYA